jgi:hypothetical protein
MVSVFPALEDFGLKITGPVDASEMQAVGHVDGSPSQQLAVEFKKLSDLP